jgi:hypothetical protein
VRRKFGRGNVVAEIKKAQNLDVALSMVSSVPGRCSRRRDAYSQNTPAYLTSIADRVV